MVPAACDAVQLRHSIDIDAVPYVRSSVSCPVTTFAPAPMPTIGALHYRCLVTAFLAVCFAVYGLLRGLLGARVCSQTHNNGSYSRPLYVLCLVCAACCPGVLLVASLFWCCVCGLGLSSCVCRFGTVGPTS